MVAVNLIIGLGYQMGSGKDTLALALMRQAPRPFESVHLLRVKEGIQVSVDAYLRAAGVEPPDWDKRTEESRAILQSQQWSRTYRSDIWLSSLWKRACDIMENDRSNLFVVPDMRFPNEVAFISAHGGVTVRVDCPEAQRRRRLIRRDGSVREEAFLAESEHGLDGLVNGDFFAVVRNQDGDDIERTAASLWRSITRTMETYPAG